MTENSKKIYEALLKIPKGKVVTYKQLSEFIGINSPRAVGRILHTNPDPTKYPCHRVVFSNGSLSEEFAFGGIEAQKKKLESEGVKFAERKFVVDLKRYLYIFTQSS